jgi:hypothetical protein
MPQAGIPRNASGAVFGQQIQESLGWIAYLVGTGIQLVFSMAWGVLFACLWPHFRRRGYEATFPALIHAVLAWIVMHAAITRGASTQPSESMPYSKACTVLTGTMSTLGLLNGRRSVSTVMSLAPPRTNTI